MGVPIAGPWTLKPLLEAPESWTFARKAHRVY